MEPIVPSFVQQKVTTDLLKPYFAAANMAAVDKRLSNTIDTIQANIAAMDKRLSNSPLVTIQATMAVIDKLSSAQSGATMAVIDKLSSAQSGATMAVIDKRLSNTLDTIQATMMAMSQLGSRTRFFPLPAEQLWPHSATADDFRRLSETLRAARETAANPKEIAEAIKRDVPKFADLGRWFLSQKGNAMAAWLSLFLAFLLYLLSRSDPKVIINNYYNTTTQITNNGPTIQEIQQFIDNEHCHGK